MDYSVQPDTFSGKKCTISDIPGDKSISHRAVIIGSLADNTSVFQNFLKAEDCLNTLSIFKQLGVPASLSPDTGDVTVSGVGLRGLRSSDSDLDVGNSGTGIRLISGLLAGQTGSYIISGDHSIQKRPMKRVIDPVASMGGMISGQFLEGSGDIYPPLKITGQQLKGISYTMPVASAQVKSAILLAGLTADGTTTLIEKAPSRDHTERMLKGFGADIQVNGRTIVLNGGKPLHNPSDQPIYIPSDISSAAFFMVLGLLVPGMEITLSKIGINKTRNGILTVLQQMGAEIAIENKAGEQVEPYADITVKTSELTNLHVDPVLVPNIIDEIPILSVAALFGKGPFTISGAKELRVKESDRIAAICDLVTAIGGRIEEKEDGFTIHPDPAAYKAFSYSPRFDHRMAMSAVIAAIAGNVRAKISQFESVNTSFPVFSQKLEAFAKSTQR